MVSLNPTQNCQWDHSCLSQTPPTTNYRFHQLLPQKLIGPFMSYTNCPQPKKLPLRHCREPLLCAENQLFSPGLACLDRSVSCQLVRVSQLLVQQEHFCN
ncbi:hypothetical protein AMECASPLE_017303 [Ameca splendens]|uniref:Uncharacterized protein n=1 Tax=Ameca splendens TaxID=208324 RepID=A0ABV0Z101_9TELE